MAVVFMEGFDWVGQNSHYTTRYTSSVLTVANSGVTTTTAFGDGRATRINSALTGGMNLIGNNIFGTNLGEFYGSFRLARATLASGNNSGNISGIIFRDGSTNQVSICFDEVGAILIRSGGTTGTTIGSAAAGTVSANTWNSYQFRIVIHNTTGSVEIRQNGGTTPLISITNVNTRAGSTNEYVNGYAIVANTAATNTNGAAEIVVDDIFINSTTGTAPIGWPGDVRIYTQAPVAAGLTTDFTPEPASAEFGRTANSTSSTIAVTNTILSYPLPTRVPYSGTISNVTFILNSAFTGTMRVGIYDNTGLSGGPGALLGQTADLVNPSGTQSVAITTPFAVAKDQELYIAYHGTAQPSLRTGTSITGFTRYTESQTFASGLTNPANASEQTSTYPVPYTLLTIIDPLNYSAASIPMDGDASYVVSNTPGHTDLYTMGSLPVVPLTIYAVEPFAVVRKGDAGARTSAVRHRSSSTEQSLATNADLGQTFTFTGQILDTDPATTTAWTASGVNNQQVGVKIEA